MFKRNTVHLFLSNWTDLIFCVNASPNTHSIRERWREKYLAQSIDLSSPLQTEPCLLRGRTGYSVSVAIGGRSLSLSGLSCRVATLVGLLELCIKLPFQPPPTNADDLLPSPGASEYMQCLS